MTQFQVKTGNDFLGSDNTLTPDIPALPDFLQ
jgi:hypothetical protein